MKVKKEVLADLSWGDLKVLSCIDVEDRERSYDVPAHVLRKYLVVHNGKAHELATIGELGAYCRARRIDAHAMIRSNFTASVQLFSGFLGHGVLIEKGSIAESVALRRGGAISLEYPQLTDSAVHWSSLKSHEDGYLIFSYRLNLPGFDLEVGNIGPIKNS